MAIEQIAAGLAAQGKTFAEDAYAPYVCARDGNEAYDVKLSDLWLCDTCAADFELRPFAGQRPAYVSTPVDGYCVNCVNKKPDVALRQWFLCGVCSRVAESFGRSVVASRGLVTLWDDQFRESTGIRLVDVDPPRLNRRDGRVKVAAIDFEGRDAQTDEVVFGLEQKTGPGGIGRGAIGPMSEFQLDCSDCDDVASVAERRDLPVFLIHAQIVERAAPPTKLWVPAGYWWTDAYAMRDACRDVRNRGGREVRPAAYYRVDMFRPIATLADFIRDGGVERFRKQVKADGRFPPMYTGQPRRI